MKKTLAFICLVIVLSMLLSTVGFADEPNTDTLADWNLRVTVPEGTTAVLKGNCYYIYVQKTGYIPYVMITTYNYDSGEKFLEDFTAYMQKQYPDLKVISEAEEVVIGDRTCIETDYSYSVSGYEVKDRRIVLTVDGLTYMFASKEIEKRGETVGDLLEEIVAGCEFLSEEAEDLVELPEDYADLTEEIEGSQEETEEPAGPEEEEPEQPGEEATGNRLLDVPADAYIYTQKDGMLKYWIDLTGSISDNVVLHCWFRSGDPVWYEKIYILELDPEEAGDPIRNVSKVTDAEGNDCTDWFKTLRIRIYDDSIKLVVKRDKNTLAGGGDDNILTGNYRMKPVRAEESSPVEETAAGLRLLPLNEGPYSTEELVEWARIRYFTETGYYPAEAAAEENSNDTVTIRLYESIEAGDIPAHMATFAWYTVDRTGNGVNGITGEAVSLFS